MPRKKTADPRRLHDDPRRHCVSVRVNEAELARLDRERGHYRRGEWLRRSWLKTTPRQAVPEVNRDAWAALARVSGNLNQLAYHANSSCSLSEKDKEKLFPLLDEVKIRVEQLRNDLLGIVPEGDDERDAED